MNRNYDRQYDKENSYDAHTAIQNKSKVTTNSELRKKLNQNLALYERDQPNTTEDEQTSRKTTDPASINCSRRENARRRGFDMKISNIDSINEKITGLLNMVKKDKQTDRKETTRQERDQRECDRSASYSITNRIKKINDSNQAEKKAPKEEAPIARFNEANPNEKRRPSYRVNNANQISQRERGDDNYDGESSTYQRYLQQEGKRRDKSANSMAPNPQRKKLQDETNNWWDELLKEEDYQKHPLTKGNRPNREIQLANDANFEKKPVDLMIEERRKQRIRHRQAEKEKEEVRADQRSRSALRLRKQERIGADDDHRDSPISKVKNDQSFQDSFSRIRTPLSRNPSRNENISRFAQISYIEQDVGKQQKINCTAKLIDEQLMRIKSKINDSEANKRRLDAMKPKGNENYKGKEYTIRIAESISSQVNLDNHLKQARQAFTNMLGESKWTELERTVSEMGFRIDSQTLKQLVTIAPDEHNPFGAEKSSTNVEGLAELLITAQKNWQNCVLKCSSLRNLKNEGFEVSELDLNKKGYLGPEDLVCFVNLYANTFYRNRDLALVMRRLYLLQGSAKNSCVEYETFLEAFSV